MATAINASDDIARAVTNTKFSQLLSHRKDALPHEARFNVAEILETKAVPEAASENWIDPERFGEDPEFEFEDPEFGPEYYEPMSPGPVVEPYPAMIDRDDFIFEQGHPVYSNEEDEMANDPYWREGETEWEPPMHDPHYHQPMPKGPTETYYTLPATDRRGHPTEQGPRKVTYERGLEPDEPNWREIPHPRPYEDFEYFPQNPHPRQNMEEDEEPNKAYWREGETEWEPPMHDPHYHQPMPKGRTETYHTMNVDPKDHPTDQGPRKITYVRGQEPKDPNWREIDPPMKFRKYVDEPQDYRGQKMEELEYG